MVSRQMLTIGKITPVIAQSCLKLLLQFPVKDTAYKAANWLPVSQSQGRGNSVNSGKTICQ
jgi:hypothetical protein